MLQTKNDFTLTYSFLECRPFPKLLSSLITKVKCFDYVGHFTEPVPVVNHFSESNSTSRRLRKDLSTFLLYGPKFT